MGRDVDDQGQKRWTEMATEMSGGQRWLKGGAVDRSVKDGQRERRRKETGVVDGRGRQERWLEMVRQDRWWGEVRSAGSGSQV